MLSLLLFREIAQMFVALVMGWLLVRFRLLKSSDSKVLSVIALYVIIPCVIIKSFQIEYTVDRVQGMLLALVSAMVTHAVFFVMAALLRKPLHLTAVEEASLIYPNGGNLTIPVVGAILGQEWVLYVSMFIVVQQVLLWSHCRLLLSGEKQFSWKKVLLNVNILSIIAGMTLFFLRIPLPSILQNAMVSVGNMVAPLTMIVAGMLMADVKFSGLFRNGALWKVTVLRLIAVVLLIMKYSGAAQLVPAGETILLISLLSSVTPSAAAVTQLAQVHSDDGPYAGLINVVTTLFCLITIPFMVAIYHL